MSKVRLLIVDDEEDLLELIVNRLKRKGYNVTGVTSAEAALELLPNNDFDVAIYDIRLPKMDGISLLKETRRLYPEIEVLMLTGHGTIETAIEAMKYGAYDYLTKPYNLSELELTITKASNNKVLKQKNETMKEIIRKYDEFTIVGESPELKEVLNFTEKIANSDVPVLIEGESGTGKELFAKALHYWSDRSDEPFIAINSGAIPEQLLESELFGHVQGAFTGANKLKKGLVEAASGGTLFLDELGEMPLSVQVKLLRFLESGEFRRVGDIRTRHVKVRVVAATNRNMEQHVADGHFREDLYYRLNVVKLIIPPLRNRKEDIKPLIDFFLEKLKREKVTLSEQAINELLKYDFPGNVRELYHLLERGLLLANGTTIDAKDLMIPGQVVESEQQVPELVSLEEVEKKHIKIVLESTNWNKKKSAEILGISVRNLYRKIDQFQFTESK